MGESDLQSGPQGPGTGEGSGAPGAQELAAAALETIERWSPKGVERTEPGPPAITFSREAVNASGPANPAETVQALVFSYRHCLWRLDQALSLDLEMAFNLDDISRHQEGRRYLLAPTRSGPGWTRSGCRAGGT
jgi:hypothetical protein